MCITPNGPNNVCWCYIRIIRPTKASSGAFLHITKVRHGVCVSRRAREERQVSMGAQGGRLDPVGVPLGARVVPSQRHGNRRHPSPQGGGSHSTLTMDSQRPWGCLSFTISKTGSRTWRRQLQSKKSHAMCCARSACVRARA